MAGPLHTSSAPSRTVRRLAAALEPPGPGRLARAARGTAFALLGLGLAAALLTAAELHLDGAAGVAVRAAVALALAAGLGLAVTRLGTRIDVMEAVRAGQDAMGEAVVLTDVESFRIVHASPAAAAVYGRPLEEVVGMDVRDLALPEERATVGERIRLRTAGHRVPGRVTMRIDHPEPRYVEWATVPLTIDRQALLLSIARDVTPGERAKRRLAEEHAFMEAVLDAAATPIVVVGRDGRVLRVNAACARMTGLAPDAMLGRTPWELGLMTADEAAAAAAALRAGRDPHHHVGAFRTPGGHERVVTWSATALRDGEGQIHSAVSIGLDVTEQRAAEERARRARAALDVRSMELERSNRDRARFAELAAHDLRESVRAVSGFAELLETHAGAALDARGRSYLAATRDAAAGMAEQLDGLAAYGRLAAGEAPLADVDCERTLDAVLSELAAEIEARGTAVTRDPLPVVPGDPAELCALLSHLLANALRFGGDAIHVGAGRRGLGWELTVSDNGAGVPESERQRVFQLFRRLHPRGAHAGAGVGLALCQRIAERHGGAIWVDERAGGGSAFHVTLPDREAR